MPPETQRGRTLTLATATALLALAVPPRAEAQSGAPILADNQRSPEEVSLPGVPVLDECGGNVPSCSTVRTPVITVEAGRHQRVKVLCGHDTFFWNWTAEASPQLVVSVLDVRRQTVDANIRTLGLHTPSVRPVRDAQNRPVGAVFRMDEQTGTRAGEGQISIGCSPEDPTGALIAQRQNVSVAPARRRR